MAEKPTYEELEKENTELKRAEEALKGNEEKFRSALMDLPIMINAVDQNSIVVFWNKKCEKITGYTAAEMIGNPNAMELLYPDREYLETELNKWAAQNYHLKNTELILSAKDGSDKTVLWTNTDFSTPEWIWAVGVDITDRKRAEGELRYRSSIEAAIAKVSSLLISSDEIDYDRILQIMGESVSVNRAYIFQIHEGGRRMANNFEWCAHGTAPQKDMLQDLETNMFPWWMGQLRNGKNIVIRNVDELPPEAAAEKEILQAQQIRSLIAVPIWSKGHALWGFMGFDDTEKTRDLSGTEIEALQIVGEIISGDLERRASEDKLEFEREQLLSIFDSIDEIIYITDPNTYEILYVNQALKDAFQKELIGGICYREFQGIDSPCDFCTNEIILKQKPAPYRWEYHNPKLGRDFTIVDRIIKWPDGHDVRFELAIDITERKRAEVALREKEKKLEHQAEHLKEVNTALKVLLEHREEEKKQSDENILVNIKKLILPYIEKIEKSKLNEKNATYLGIIKSNLLELVSPFENRLSSKLFELTPSEIQIADLIKHGKTSKEIASLLNVSPKAISFHRGNIRKKLGLANKKINLISYLQSFPSD
jgi:PAS domain S-box-containing protein